MNEAPNLPEGISPLDLYRVFRSRVEHEDNLIVQRLSWLVASQSFLFTAYAIVMNGLIGGSTPDSALFRSKELLLFRLLPVVGILTSLLIYLSILAALRALRELRRLYRTQSNRSDALALQTGGATRTLGLSAPVVLPVVFIAVWLCLLIAHWN